MGIGKPIIKVHDPGQIVRMDKIEQVAFAAQDIFHRAAQQGLDIFVYQQDVVAVVWGQGNEQAFAVIEMTAHSPVVALQFNDAILKIRDVRQAAADARGVGIDPAQVPAKMPSGGPGARRWWNAATRNGWVPRKPLQAAADNPTPGGDPNRPPGSKKSCR